MASFIYDSALAKLQDGSLDLDTDTIKIALVTSSYTANRATHDFFDDVTNEVSGTGYTAGGATLGSKTVTADTTNHRGTFDAADPSWSTATITARGAVVYKSTGSAATSALIEYIDFGADKISTAGTFLVTLDSLGIHYFQG